MIQDEDLYRLVFEFADEQWHSWCSNDEDGWQYVLVEQYDTVDKSSCMCRGKVKKAWVRDDSGLREISTSEHKVYSDKGDEVVWRYVRVEFYIYPDKSRMALGQRGASRAGRGGRYLIQNTAKGLKLEPDPTGAFWMS